MDCSVVFHVWSQNCSVSFTGELVRNAKSQASPWTNCIRNSGSGPAHFSQALQVVQVWGSPTCWLRWVTAAVKTRVHCCCFLFYLSKGRKELKQKSIQVTSLCLHDPPFWSWTWEKEWETNTCLLQIVSVVFQIALSSGMKIPWRHGIYFPPCVWHSLYSLWD